MIQKRQADVERVLAQTREEAAGLRVANDGLRKEMEDLRSKITTVETEPICPICRSPARSGRPRPPRRRVHRRREGPEGPLRREPGPRQSARRHHRAARGRPQAPARRDRPARRRRAPAGERRAPPWRPPAPPPARSRPPARSLPASTACSPATPTPRPRPPGSARSRPASTRSATTRRPTAASARSLPPWSTTSASATSWPAPARQTALRDEALQQARASLASWQERLDEDRKRIAVLDQEVRGLPGPPRPRRRRRAPPSPRFGASTPAATAALGEARQRLSYLDRLEAEPRRAHPRA